MSIDRNKKTLTFFTAFYGDVLGHGNDYQKNLEESLNYVIENLNNKYNIIIKTHPNEELSYWKNVFKFKNITLIKNINNFDLMLISDIMISSNSYASVEATLLGVTTINFVPGANIISKEFCNLFNQFVSVVEYSKESLLKRLNNYLSVDISYKNDTIIAQNNILGLNSDKKNYLVEEIMDIKLNK